MTDINLNKVERAGLLTAYLELVAYAQRLGIEKLPKVTIKTITSPVTGSRYVRNILKDILAKEFDVDLEIKTQRTRRYYNQRNIEYKEYVIFINHLLMNLSNAIRDLYNRRGDWTNTRHAIPFDKDHIAILLLKEQINKNLIDIHRYMGNGYNLRLHWQPGESLLTSIKNLKSGIELLRETETLYKQAITVRMLTDMQLNARGV
jgi:hypothetical protein